MGSWLKNASSLFALLTNATNNTVFLDTCYSLRYHYASPTMIATEKACTYLSFVFVIVGLVGNFLSGIVFSSAAMRSGPCNIFLFVLAVSDSTYLIALFLGKVLPSLRCLNVVDDALDVYNQYDVWCKLLQYLMDFSANYSSCLILAFTAERLLAVYRPVMFKSMSNARFAKYTCCGMLGVIAVGILPHHVMFMTVRHMKCTISEEHERLFSDFYLAEISLCRIIPVILITAFNASIVLKLIQQPATISKRRRHVSTQIALNSRHSAEIVELVEASRTTRTDRNQQVTVMLVVVSTSYILTYIPVLIHFILNKFDRNLQIDGESLGIAAHITRVMYVLGFVINFFLYTVSGKVFREQLVLIVCRCRSKKRTRVKQTSHTNLNGRATNENAGEVTTLV